VPFRWLLAARTIATLGNSAAPIALAFAVLDLTGSAVDLAVGEILVGPLAHVFGTTPVLLGCAVVIVVASLAAASVRSVRHLTVGPPSASTTEAPVADDPARVAGL
jgi:hypothetical protein